MDYQDTPTQLQKYYFNNAHNIIASNNVFYGNSPTIGFQNNSGNDGQEILLPDANGIVKINLISGTTITTKSITSV
jgi:hypothetical protein